MVDKNCGTMPPAASFLKRRGDICAASIRMIFGRNRSGSVPPSRHLIPTFSCNGGIGCERISKPELSGFPFVEGGSGPEDSVERPRSLPDKVVASSSDALALAIKIYLEPHPPARFAALCQENGIDSMKYAGPGKGFGLQRMALGNELRNRLKKGEAVKVNGQVIK